MRGWPRLSGSGCLYLGTAITTESPNETSRSRPCVDAHSHVTPEPINCSASTVYSPSSSTRGDHESLCVLLVRNPMLSKGSLASPVCLGLEGPWTVAPSQSLQASTLDGRGMPSDIPALRARSRPLAQETHARSKCGACTYRMFVPSNVLTPQCAPIASVQYPRRFCINSRVCCGHLHVLVCALSGETRPRPGAGGNWPLDTMLEAGPMSR